MRTGDGEPSAATGAAFGASRWSASSLPGGHVRGRSLLPPRARPCLCPSPEEDGRNPSYHTMSRQEVPVSIHQTPSFAREGSTNQLPLCVVPPPAMVRGGKQHGGHFIHSSVSVNWLIQSFFVQCLRNSRSQCSVMSSPTGHDIILLKLLVLHIPKM